MRQAGDHGLASVVDVEGADSGVESEPPALDPIPKVEPISVDEAAIEPDDTQDKATPGPIPAVDATHSSPTTKEPTNSNNSVETGEDVPGQSPPLNAEMIAQRVFSASVVDEPKHGGLISSTVPTTTETATSDERKSIGPDATAPAAIQSSSESPAKHGESVASRIAPSIPVASTAKAAPEPPSTKTTVTAGTPSATTSKIAPKEKDSKSEGKVSSWLKTKFARRSSKPAKPEISEPSPAEPVSEKGFIGGANLTGASNTSVNRSATGESEREVAMAQSGGATPGAAPVSSNIVEVAADIDYYEVSPAGKPRRSLSSSSISSLSSDEDIDDVRGRNRLPREPTPMTHNLKGTLRGQPLQGAAAAEGPEGVASVPAASGTGRNLGRESTEVEEEEEFEEARDAFDSEALPPPRSVGEGATGRGSDSPARDSKFHEAL